MLRYIMRYRDTELFEQSSVPSPFKTRLDIVEPTTLTELVRQNAAKAVYMSGFNTCKNRSCGVKFGGKRESKYCTPLCRTVATRDNIVAIWYDFISGTFSTSAQGNALQVLQFTSDEADEIYQNVHIIDNVIDFLDRYYPVNTYALHPDPVSRTFTWRRGIRSIKDNVIRTRQFRTDIYTVYDLSIKCSYPNRFNIFFDAATDTFNTESGNTLVYSRIMSPLQLMKTKSLYDGKQLTHDQFWSIVEGT